MLCYAMLCYAMLCYAMLCYAMLCYAMPLFAAIYPSKSHDVCCYSRSVSKFTVLSCCKHNTIRTSAGESWHPSENIDRKRYMPCTLCPHCICKHSILTPVVSLMTTHIGTCMHTCMHVHVHITHSTCLHTYPNTHTHAGWVRGYWREGGHAMHAVPSPHVQAQHDQARSVIMPRV